MQGIPPEDLESYVSLLSNSPEGSPKGAVNNEVASEIGSLISLEGFKIVSNSLEAFRLLINPLLSVRQDPHFLWMNSLGELVVDENIEVPTGPNAESGVDDPLFQSESFITPLHTAGIFNLRSVPVRSIWGTAGHDIFDTLGKSHNQPMASQMPETSVTYTIPLDHFTGTTSNVVTVLDQLLVFSLNSSSPDRSLYYGPTIYDCSY
jgi:hypothetical protein